LRGGEPLSRLCAEFGISRPTGYCWLARYREGGVAAIEERSRRPHESPTKTGAELETQVVALRKKYPDWGARKLAVLLARQGIGLPSSTIHRVLLRHGLVRDQDRHAPATTRFERDHPNELWQMDFKGPKKWPKSSTALSVIDDHSRYVVALEATARPEGRLVQRHLIRAFEQCGLPEAMLMDHGIPWWQAQSLCRRHLSEPVADAPGHRAAFFRHTPSADARQGGAVPRQHGTGARLSRCARRGSSVVAR